tara:strand:- start:1205 stop:1729 length:525 start_codon:yes stop_codon:yes gene_type:complete
MANLSIYVGTYAKYNEGSLKGQWLRIPDYADYPELQNAMYELHNDEDDPEFMIQDFEGDAIFELLSLVSESHISESVFDIIDSLENCNYALQVLESYIYCFGNYSENIEELVEAIEESYQGQYNSDVCFTQTLLEDCGDIPTNLPHYIHIDWESTSNDIMMDYSTVNGHYFRNI